MRYLSVKQIIKINAKILAGTSALRDRNGLESAAARPKASAFGEDAYPTLVEKAAALLHSLVLNHPFVDGNKRTASVAMTLFLKRNGLRPSWNQPEALEFIIEAAEGKHDVAAIARWLAANTQPIP